jgi:hypothetical protein
MGQLVTAVMAELPAASETECKVLVRKVTNETHIDVGFRQGITAERHYCRRGAKPPWLVVAV